jgi:hypothetical protein
MHVQEHLRAGNDTSKADVKGELPRVVLVLVSLRGVCHQDARPYWNLSLPPIKIHDSGDKLLRHDLDFACVINWN